MGRNRHLWHEPEATGYTQHNRPRDPRLDHDFARMMEAHIRRQCGAGSPEHRAAAGVVEDTRPAI